MYPDPDQPEHFVVYYALKLLFDHVVVIIIFVSDLLICLFQELKKKLTSLTSEVCFYLSKTASLRDISKQFLTALEVMVSETECPFVYIDPEFVSTIGTKIPNSETQAYLLYCSLSLKYFSLITELFILRFTD